MGKVKSIYREKDILNLCKHPNVIQLNGTTHDQTDLYFIFDNCENGDLQDLISKKSQIPIEVAKIYMAQLVSVLELFQSHGIMHRDMKPANILLDDKMNIKVIDFGEAKQYGEEDPVDSQTGPVDKEVEGF